MKKLKFFFLLLIIFFAFGCRSKAEIIFRDKFQMIYSSTKSFGDAIPQKELFFCRNAKVNGLIQKKLDLILPNLKFSQKASEVEQILGFKIKLKKYNIMMLDFEEFDSYRNYHIGAFMMMEHKYGLFGECKIKIDTTNEKDLIEMQENVDGSESMIRKYNADISRYGNRYINKTITKKVPDGYEEVTVTRNGRTYTETKPKYRYETETITEPNPEYNPQRAEEAQQKKIYWQKQKVNYKREVNSLLEKMISFEQINK